MRSPLPALFVVATALGFAFVAPGCQFSAETDDEDDPIVVDPDAFSGAEDAGESGEPDAHSEDEEETEETEDEDAGRGDTSDTGDESDPGDTGQEEDTSESIDPEPTRVEGPADRQAHTCPDICGTEGMECTQSCTDSEGRQVAGVAEYLVNVSGETYEVPEPIESCSSDVEYSSGRTLRTSFWCCCQ